MLDALRGRREGGASAGGHPRALSAGLGDPDDARRVNDELTHVGARWRPAHGVERIEWRNEAGPGTGLGRVRARARGWRPWPWRQHALEGYATGVGVSGIGPKPRRSFSLPPRVCQGEAPARICTPKAWSPRTAMGASTSGRRRAAAHRQGQRARAWLGHCKRCLGSRPVRGAH